MSEEMKTCPFCAETIKAAAVVCRYCQREIPVGIRPADLDRPDLPRRLPMQAQALLIGAIVALVALAATSFLVIGRLTTTDNVAPAQTATAVEKAQP